MIDRIKTALYYVNKVCVHVCVRRREKGGGGNGEGHRSAGAIMFA